MRVLVVGTLPGAIERAALTLSAAGHEVVRCHEAGEPPFPCRGLADGASCPLEAAPVDVVVTARDRPWPRPSPFEDGVTCALRRHVPLVVTGNWSLHPFDRWTPRELAADDDLVAACVLAAAAPLERHGRVAQDAARGAAERLGLDASAVTARVERSRGRLHVEVRLPAAARRHESGITAGVIGALRALDPHAGSIDVSVEEAPTPDGFDA